jgi:hypothetical protein
LFLVISILCFIVVLTIHFFRTSDKFEYRTTTSPPETTTIDSRFENKKLNGTFIFKESRRAHRLLDGLFGLEIGASFHNPYGLKTLNIDYTDEITPFSQHALDYGFTIPKGFFLNFCDKIYLSSYCLPGRQSSFYQRFC